MEYLDLTANSSILKTTCAVVGLTNFVIKMLRLRLISYLLLTISVACGQQAPYGSTAVPFTPTALIPTSIPSSPLPTAIAPFAPNAFPFGPTTRPGYNPYNNSPYNNPYYNPAAGPAIPILTYTNDHNADGSYSYSYSSADGKQVQESGYLKDAYIDNVGEPQGTQVVQGSYSYISPEGTPIQVNYVADENGFRPSGLHFPTDGKAIPPLAVPLDGRKDNIFNRYDTYNRYDAYRDPYRRDPFNRDLYNRHDPYNNRRYNYPFNRSYDARYPYPSRYDPYNRPFGNNKDAKPEAKKET